MKRVDGKPQRERSRPALRRGWQRRQPRSGFEDAKAKTPGLSNRSGVVGPLASSTRAILAGKNKTSTHWLEFFFGRPVGFCKLRTFSISSGLKNRLPPAMVPMRPSMQSCRIRDGLRDNRFATSFVVNSFSRSAIVIPFFYHSYVNVSMSDPDSELIRLARRDFEMSNKT